MQVIGSLMLEVEVELFRCSEMIGFVEMKSARVLTAGLIFFCMGW